MYLFIFALPLSFVSRYLCGSYFSQKSWKFLDLLSRINCNSRPRALNRLVGGISLASKVYFVQTKLKLRTLVHFATCTYEFSALNTRLNVYTSSN